MGIVSCLLPLHEIAFFGGWLGSFRRLRLGGVAPTETARLARANAFSSPRADAEIARDFARTVEASKDRQLPGCNR